MAIFTDFGTLGVIDTEEDSFEIYVGTTVEGKPILHFDNGFSLEPDELLKLYEWIGEWLRAAGKIE